MNLSALDLFCGGGGSSMGLKQAGFKEIIGVDINHQPEYPFKFILSDIFDLDKNFLSQFDFIWASPPCQAYSFACSRIRNNGKEYPDLIDKTRELLIFIGKPFVIENVCQAPLFKNLMLCGEMFGLKVIRHRIFEIYGFKILQPIHIKHRGSIKDGFYITVAGHGGDGKADLKEWQKAIGIDWIANKKTLVQAVPPAYAEYVGRQFILSRN